MRLNGLVLAIVQDKEVRWERQNEAQLSCLGYCSRQKLLNIIDLFKCEHGAA